MAPKKRESTADEIARAIRLALKDKDEKEVLTEIRISTALLEQSVEMLSMSLQEHKKKHWTITTIALGALLGAVLSLLVAWVK